MYSKYVLKNNLRVILMPMKGTETVTVLAAINAGSRFEMPQEAGLAHFLEHMAFKGTKRRPSAMHISKELDSVGAEYNAFTSKEVIAFYAKTAKEHGPLAIDIIADMLTSAKLPAEEIEREKGVIVEEMRLYQDTPMRYIDDIFEELMFGASSTMGKMIIGTEGTIRSFSRKMFTNYQEGLYRASNIVVCVAGKIIPEQVLHNVQRHFGGISDGPVRSSTSTPIDQTRPRARVHWKKTDQTHLMVGFRGYDLKHPRRIASELLATILGGGMSSRLFHAVRERRGLAYYVRASSQHFTDVGYLAAQAGVTNEKVNLAIRQILLEFKKMKTKRVDANELRKAKDYIKGHIRLSLESSDEVASWGSMQEVLEKKILTVDEIFKRVDRISANDIRRAAKELFTPEKLNLALIGPFRDPKPFEKLLKV